MVVGDINHGSMTEDTDSYTTHNPQHIGGEQSESLYSRNAQSVSVVTRQCINDQSMTSLDDAMRQVTGRRERD
ncbi:hypothetical protein M5G07_11065 [Serratia symbiotica]|nr:hypothetical protein [Serratia symbiotica]